MSAPVLIDGRWRSRDGDTFTSHDPATGEALGRYPVSPWPDIDAALAAGAGAYRELREQPPERIAAFLRRYAERIEARAGDIVAAAHRETALPASPRLAEVELPRTTNQLRQAADAAEQRAWVGPTISPAARIAAWHRPIPGVVCVLGPNNFPMAFNGVAGGDFAAAIATHHPVLAKAHPGHPLTTRLLAEAAREALDDAGLPGATVQLVYHMAADDGTRMVADPRVAATAFTGSRRGGLALKAAADAAGRPIYLEMSSVNPVVVLPGAAAERADEIAEALTGSLLLGNGQFCTNPGLVFVVAGDATSRLVTRMREHVQAATPGTLLGPGVRDGLEAARARWSNAGADVIAESTHPAPAGAFPPTLMQVDGERFRAHSEALQEEAFGNVGLIVEAGSLDALIEHLDVLAGNLTGTVYTAGDGADDAAYERVAAVLGERVGRLLNDKPPTGVAVDPAMHHGGPYPATGHPSFTSVGVPASLARFAMRQAFDNVPDHRLPAALKADNPLALQRCVNGEWTREPFVWGEARP